MADEIIQTGYSIGASDHGRPSADQCLMTAGVRTSTVVADEPSRGNFDDRGATPKNGTDTVAAVGRSLAFQPIRKAKAGSYGAIALTRYDNVSVVALVNDAIEVVIKQSVEFRLNFFCSCSVLDTRGCFFKALMLQTEFEQTGVVATVCCNDRRIGIHDELRNLRRGTAAAAAAAN